MSNEDVKYTASKSDIWKAYKEIKAQVDSNATSVTTTTGIAQKAKVDSAVKTASSVDVNAVSTSVTALVNQISDATTQYSDVLTAIDAKKSELKTVHGIEVEANTLVAIVATKDQLVAEKNEQAKVIIFDADEKAKSIIATATMRRDEITNSIATTQKVTEQARERSTEEWDYTFSRKKKADVDSLQDILDGKIKVVADREVIVTDREALADDKDASILSLSEKIDSINSSISTQIEEAVVKAKKGSETSHNIAKSMISKEHAAETSIKEAKIVTLEEKVAELTSQLNKATEAVANAQDKVSNMAQSALKAQGDVATITEVSKIAANGGKK